MQVTLQGTPNQTYICANNPVSGNYTADADGIIVVQAPSYKDVQDLQNQGCQVIPYSSTGLAGALIGRLIGANMNTTADQAFSMTQYAQLNPSRISKITATNASVSLTTAVGGIYPAAAKGGTAAVANSQVYSALTTAAIALDLTLAAGTVVYSKGGQLYLSLTSPQGAAATADLYVWGDVYALA